MVCCLRREQRKHMKGSKSGSSKCEWVPRLSPAEEKTDQLKVQGNQPHRAIWTWRQRKELITVTTMTISLWSWRDPRDDSLTDEVDTFTLVSNRYQQRHSLFRIYYLYGEINMYFAAYCKCLLFFKTGRRFVMQQLYLFLEYIYMVCKEMLLNRKRLVGTVIKCAESV